MRKIDFDKETSNYRWIAGTIINMVKTSPVRATCSCGARLWFSESDTRPAIQSFAKEHHQHGTLLIEDMELVVTQ